MPKPRAPAIRLLETSAEVIQVCGGPVKFGRLTGRNKQLSNYYKKKNSLPGDCVLIIQAELLRHSCTASMKLFGIKEPANAA